MRRVIDDRFELVRRLGGGGMGTVWRARDLALERDVALKEVRPPDPALAEYDPEGARALRARVLREARALARVDHPNVVTIHHIVDEGEDTFPWLVMELVTGGSLQDRLSRGTMAPADAARLGREVLSALRTAHAAGVEHRDVKPANVLLRPDGRAVLTDFGIAAIREATTLTATGSMIGSPDYMAPERVAGEDGGPAADLWSLGMMLYVAVEGRHPLRRANTLATLAAVLNAELPPPVAAGPLTAVLEAVLVRDPAARPDAETLDGLLAEASAGPAGAAGAAGAEPGAEAEAEAEAATSFPLAPPTPAPTPVLAPTPDPQAPSGADGPTRSPRPSPRPRSRVRIGAMALTAAAVTGGILAWGLMDDSEGGKSKAEGSRSSSSASPSASSSTSSSPSSGPDEDAPKDLLTPAGIRGAIKELEPLMGTSKVTSFVVGPDRITAQALVKGDPDRYNRFAYTTAEGATRDGVGGRVILGVVPVELGSVDWDLVPALLTEAAKVAGIDQTTTRHLALDTYAPKSVNSTDSDTAFKVRVDLTTRDGTSGVAIKVGKEGGMTASPLS